MKRKTVINALLTYCVAFGMLSCTDMDEYKKISGDKEIVYPGKIQDVTVYSGDSRLVVEGLCNSDPKVTNCRICWNLDADYVDVPVDMSGGSYWLKKEIALPENSYNFNIYTYDAEGNRSIPVSVTGKSYGTSTRLLSATAWSSLFPCRTVGPSSNGGKSTRPSGRLPPRWCIPTTRALK